MCFSEASATDGIVMAESGKCKAKQKYDEENRTVLSEWAEFIFIKEMGDHFAYFAKLHCLNLKP